MTVYTGKKVSAETRATSRAAGVLVPIVESPDVTPASKGIAAPAFFGPSPITLTLDGGGSVIATGFKGFASIPFAFTITSWTMLSQESTTSVIDIWECTYAEFDMVAHPVVGDTIVASAKPTITAAFKATNATLTGWTKVFPAGTILAFNLDSNNNSKLLVLQLAIEKV